MVLVTGGFGYVGSRLTPFLLEHGHAVKVLDLCLYGDDGMEALKAHPKWAPEFSSRFEWIRGDLRDSSVVRQALRGCESVIHLAAISNDPTGDIDEVLTRQVNFDAVGMLVAMARENGVKRFINASSSSVFGARQESDITERLEPEPLTYYSKYKMLSEWIVRGAASPNFVTVNVRPATICGYSPRQRFDLTVNKLTADAVKKGVITVHGGQQRRPNVGINDMINLYLSLLKMPAERINGRTFNFGFENHKVIALAEIIQREIGADRVRIDVKDVVDNRDYHISSARIQQELGYSPTSSIVKEVAQLRSALDAGKFPDIEAVKHYNMKMMKLDRNAAAYQFLSL